MASTTMDYENENGARYEGTLRSNYLSSLFVAFTPARKLFS